MHYLIGLVVVAVLGYGLFMIFSHIGLHNRLSTLEEGVIHLESRVKALLKKLS